MVGTNTLLLRKSDGGVNTFEKNVSRDYINKFVPLKRKKEINIEQKLAAVFCNSFFNFEAGAVYLNFLNWIYDLQYIEEKTDLVLPKNPFHGDWILLTFSQPYAIIQLNQDKKPIKIYGNGNKIMGLDEPLICDVTFLCLKLIYCDVQNGWIIS